MARLAQESPLEALGHRLARLQFSFAVRRVTEAVALAVTLDVAYDLIAYGVGALSGQNLYLSWLSVILFAVLLAKASFSLRREAVASS
ncbi:MAG: hypothetical protein IH608_11080, partial [Proteobacteria bacterium]|nr:hypothetical protein [Pseudomonadota bacterium]